MHFVLQFTNYFLLNSVYSVSDFKQANQSLASDIIEVCTHKDRDSRAQITFDHIHHVQELLLPFSIYFKYFSFSDSKFFKSTNHHFTVSLEKSNNHLVLVR